MGVGTTKKSPSISHLSLLSPSAKSQIPNPKTPKKIKSINYERRKQEPLCISTFETEDLMVNIISWTSIRGVLIMTMMNLRRALVGVCPMVNFFLSKSGS